MVGLCISGIFILLFSRAINRTFSHDEHQFVASAELLTRQLLPFRDFPYQHLPYLSFVFALSGSLSDLSLLGARNVSVLAATASVLVLFVLVWRFSRAYPCGWRLLLGVGSVLVFVMNPLFYLTSGKAWNHDLPTLLTLGAVLLMGDEDRRLPDPAGLFWAGFLLGLAVGTRLSYLTALAPFIMLVLLKPGAETWRVRFRGVGFLVAGGTLALLPVAVLFALSPGGFVFDNIVYPQLNTVYREVLGQQEAMGFGSKMVYFVETIAMDWQSLMLYLPFGGILLGALVTGDELLLWVRSPGR